MTEGHLTKAVSRVRRLLPYLALAALLALSVAFWRSYQDHSQERERRRFEKHVDATVAGITERLERYKMILQGGGGLFLTSEEVTRDEWRAYYEYRQVRTLYPGILGLGFATVVRPEDLARHIEQVRAEGFPDYTVRPAGEREVYTSIVFLEPFDAANQRAFGYDMFSEPVRRQAMARARDTGQVALSGRVTLVQNPDGDDLPGCLLYVPIYTRGMPLETVADRRAALRGYVYAPFRVGDLMHAIFPNPVNEIDFDLYDGAEASPSGLMYDSCVTAGAPRQPMFTARRTLNLYGHQWTLDFETMPALEAAVDRYTPWLILAGGVLISLLLFLLHRSLTGSADRAQLLAESMTSALWESEARYRVLNDTLPVGVSIIGPNMEIQASNAVKHRWFPYHGAAPCPPCYEVYSNPPRTEPCPGCPVVLTFQDGQSHVAEREAVTTMGQRTLLISTTPLFGPDGKVARVHEVVEDITERKQMERFEQQRTAILASIAQGTQSVGDTLLLIVKLIEDQNPDALASVLLLDDRGERLLLGAAPSLPDFYNQAVHGLRIGDGVGSCGTAAYTAQRVIVEDVLVHPYWVAFRDLAQQANLRACWSEPVLSGDGRVLGTFAIYKREPGPPSHAEIAQIDVAAKLVALALLHQQAVSDRIARQAAEAANREKSRFLANMSHEIRTPMNAILGFAQIIERDPHLDPAHATRIRSINRAGQHLLALINDILDMAKIEAGMTVLKPRAFCLHDLLDDLQIMFRSRAEAKGLQLLMERDTGVPSIVLADDAKLRQVLVNLIGNAVKFTQQGGVAVRVRAEPAAAEAVGRVRLIVEVEDSGPGIPAADRERIFGAFVQSEAGGNMGGTGLGLPISRRLVEMMGGSLTVQSEVGRGSCFRFDVVLELAEALPVETESEARRLVVGLAPGTGPWRVLVVDDVQDNRDLLRDLLQPVGFEIREARNGAEALAAFAEWSPHAVLMDMRMAGMDGYEATRRIKASEAGRNAPVIAVTASAFRESEAEIRQTGVSAYLRKPFRAAEIFEILGRCLDLRYVYADEPEKTREPAKASALTPESVAALPAELRRAMQEAVAEGDMALLAELLGQARTIDAAVAAGLHALAERYDYGKLDELLANGGSDHG